MKSAFAVRRDVVTCLVAIVLSSGAGARPQSTGKARALQPLDRVRVLPEHLNHQRREVTNFESVRLDVPSSLDVPFRIVVPWDGHPHALDLALHSVRDGEYGLLLVRDGQVREARDPGPVVTFRGTVEDDKDAVVAGALLVSGMQAVVVLGDGRHIEIQPDYEAFQLGLFDRFLVFDAASAAPCCDTTCGVDDRHRLGTPPPPPPPGWTPACQGDLCLAEIAFDCDFPLYQTFASSSTLVADIAEHTLNVANIQYERELHLTHRLKTTLIRTSAGSEPAAYAASIDRNTLLSAFQNEWIANQGGVARDLAHLLTGRYSGGLAYIGVTCSDPFNSYGLSSVQFALIAGNVGLTCYANVLAHELGHNWGANHCACQSPAYTMNPSFRPCPLRFDPATSLLEIDAWRDANSGCLSSSVYNDACAYALEVCAGSFVDSTIGATIDGTQSCNTNGPDVWYLYRPAANGTLTVDTCGAATNFDTILSIHGACPGTTANQLACSDDACGTSGLASNVSAAVTAGATYWIRVGGYAGATGTFALNVVAPTCRPPANDARAAAMDVGPGSYFGNTTGATNDGVASCGTSSASKDVWFRYTPYTTEIVTASTFGSSYDTVLTVYDASGSMELFCNDDAPSGTLQSFVQFSAGGGTTYLLRVSGFNGAAGAFELDLGGPDSANTVCGGALVLSAGVRLGTFEGVFATEGASSCPHDEEPDLWYRYVATSAGTLDVRTCGTHDLNGQDTGPDTVLSLHSACPGSAANQITCNDDNFSTCGALDAGSLRDSFVSTPVASGQSIYVRVSRYSAFQGRNPFVLRLDLRPANDACANAIAIGNGVLAGTLVGATNDGAASCGAAGQADVWYSYTATCTGTLLVTTCGTHDAGGVDSSTDTVVSLHSACPGGVGNELACNDDSLTCGSVDQGQPRDSRVSIGVTTGQVVKIRVSHHPGTVAGFTLRTSCGSGAAYCFGDGYYLSCPCGNSAPPGATGGCLNSLGLDGRLVASGVTRIAADSLVLAGSNMATTGTCLYFQGSGTSVPIWGTLFGDGLRCAAGTVIRLGTKTNAGGASSYPTGGDPSVSVRGLVAAPGKRYYQVWYRNSAAFCTASTFNLTNGLEVNWLP